MFADESSNSSTSSASSFRSTMFMIDNLLQKASSRPSAFSEVRPAANQTETVPRMAPETSHVEGSARTPTASGRAELKMSHVLSHARSSPTPDYTEPIRELAPRTKAAPSHPEAARPALGYAEIGRFTALTPTNAGPVLRQTPPQPSYSHRQGESLSETLYRSLDVVRANEQLPEYKATLLKSTVVEANTRISELCSEHPSQETLPLKKRHRLEPDQPRVVTEYESMMLTERSSSPTNSSTSSLEDDAVNGDKKKKPRTCFTNHQLSELERVFRSQRYLPSEERNHVAIRLQLTERKVKTWFQNRRMKDKRVPTDEPAHKPMTSQMSAQSNTPFTSGGLRSLTSLPPGSNQIPVSSFALPQSIAAMPYSHMHSNHVSQSSLDFAYNSMMPFYGYSPLKASFVVPENELCLYQREPGSSTTMTSL